MAINKDLFRQIRDKILSAPEAYDQTVDAMPSEVSPCGSAACIFGWALILSGEATVTDIDEEWVDCYLRGKRLLGLTGRQPEIVYDPDGDEWPEEFRHGLHSEDAQTRALAAAGYINHIIETGDVI